MNFGNETWVPYFNPKSQSQSKNLKLEEGPPLKTHILPSDGKVMLTIFRDCEGIIFTDYLSKSTTINAEYYTNLLFGTLRQELVRKRSGKLHKYPLLQQDTTRPHTARKMKDVLYNLRWQLLPHPPPYSSDLGPILHSH
ncbi:hypothetical protein Trydic_g13834 [Trypoxylus dichotomus]